MASLRYSIRAYALEQSDPGAILEKLGTMMDLTSDDMFATVICGALDATAGTLTVARAGHPDLLVVDRHGAHYLNVPLGPPVGVDPTWSYESLTRILPADTTLLAYTDGLIERRREHLDVGLERLRVAALAELPIDGLVSHLVDKLVVDGEDDVAVLGMHWSGVGTRAIALPSEPDAARRARTFVHEALHAWRLEDADHLAELLTDELVSNVVRHVGLPMEVRTSHNGTSVRVEVDDASTQPPIRRDPEQFDEHGRGILLVESAASDWGVDVRADGKTIWFEVPVVAAPS
jgi:hypothetical protein